MTNARTVTMSLDHLVAEMIAFPFVSVEGLQGPLESLDTRLADGTAALWRGAERYFVAHFPHVGIDELIAVRNRTWFGSNEDLVSLHRYLQRSARNWLTTRGAIAFPKLPEGACRHDNHDAAARRAWRWLTFAMPGDLLLAGLACDGFGPVRCNLLTPFVERMLAERGFAETHLHLGAALDFPTAWASAVNIVARAAHPNPKAPDMRYQAFSSPGAEHREGRSLANWLVRSAIARYLLAAFLTWGRQRSGTMAKFLNDPDLWPKIGLSVDHRDALVIAIRDLAAGRLTLPDDGQHQDPWESSFIALQHAYNALTRASTIPIPENLDDVQSLDPLSVFYQPQGHAGPSVQMQFLWAGLDYLHQETGDRTFAKLFWQTERVRCQVYRHCVQRPLTPGLMNFIRVYDRKGAVTRALESIELESAGVLSGVGKGLRSLEVRTRPDWRKNDQLAFLTSLKAKYEGLRNTKIDWGPVECGLVLHFLKFRGDRSDHGLPHADDVENHADPGLDANTMQLRWQYFRQQVEGRADALSDAIDQEPELLTFLRALDVCRDEHGVPCWVIAPMFRRVRDRADEAIAQHYATHGEELPRLHTTAHVGEDFVHLATGLRYMDEAMEHLPLSVGDRVGHGLALGIDPRVWADNQQRQLLPREDRWFDLIWERKWHARQGSQFSSGRKTYIDDQIIQLSREIFGDWEEDHAFTWTAELAVEMYDALFDGTLENLGFPNMSSDREFPQSRIERLVQRYITSPSIYRRCRKVIWVDVSHEGDAIAELQRLVRLQYAENGITIEVNPISNLMVGDLTDLTSHPLWRLAPGLGDHYGATLRMCVGSDDPLPFATSLPEEYQFLYDSLLLAGRSHADARIWLDKIRQMGLGARFTEPMDPITLTNGEIA